MKELNFLTRLRMSSMFPMGQPSFASRTVRYADLLVYIAAADGELVRREIATIEAMMGRPSSSRIALPYGLGLNSPFRSNNPRRPRYGLAQII